MYPTLDKKADTHSRSCPPPKKKDESGREREGEVEKGPLEKTSG